MASDPVIELVGEGGSYQVLVGFLLCFVHVSVSIEQVYVNFLTPHLDFWCYVPELKELSHELQKAWAVPFDTITNQLDYCSVIKRNWTEYLQNVSMNIATDSEDYTVEKCTSGFTFDESFFTSSATSQFSLVCENAWILEIISPIYAAGLVIGPLMSGNIADTLGRKASLLIFMLIHMFAAVGVAFSLNIWMMIFFRVVVAISIQGAALSAMILLLEIAPGKLREAASVFYFVSYCCGTLLLAGIANMVPDYRYMQLAISLPFTVCFLYYWFVPESPLWLISKGMHEKAVDQVRKIVKYNRNPIPEDMLIEYTQKKVNKLEMALEEMPAVEPVGYAALVKNRTVFFYVIALTISACATQIIYMGTTFNLSQLSGNLYQNLILSAGLEIPVVTSLTILLPKLGRKPLFVFVFIMMAIVSFACVLLYFIPGMEMIITYLSLSNRIFGVCSSTILSIYFSELFPTALRQKASGVVTGCYGVAIMIAPIIGGTLRVIWDPLPNIIYGGLAIISLVFVTIFLPETKGKQLPETISEAGELKKTNKPGAARKLSTARMDDKCVLKADTIGSYQMMFTGVTAVTLNFGDMHQGTNENNLTSGVNIV